jgi:glycosyltransferase involved in cell wall biosynthesis
MDLYPNVAVQGGLLKETGLLTGFLTTLSRFTLKNADPLIVIGRCMQENMQKIGVSPEHIFVVPNWANETEIYPVPHSKNQLRQELGVEDDAFVVLYTGNIGFSHFFDDILEVARRLRDVPHLYFMFIGNGVRRKEVEQAREMHNLKNVLLLPFQPIDKWADTFGLGDIHFVSLRTGFEGVVVPSKTYSVLSAGRPVIYQGSPYGEIARMIAEEEIGTVVPLSNPDVLEQAILHYLDNPMLVEEQGEKAYRLTKERLSREHAIMKYFQVLSGCLPDENILAKAS